MNIGFFFYVLLIVTIFQGKFAIFIKYLGKLQIGIRGGYFYNKNRNKLCWHYENKSIQIYWKFYHQKKNEIFWIKILIFFIFLPKTWILGIR